MKKLTLIALTAAFALATSASAWWIFGPKAAPAQEEGTTPAAAAAGQGRLVLCPRIGYSIRPVAAAAATGYAGQGRGARTPAADDPSPFKE